MDELDRTALAVLLPDTRDQFRLRQPSRSLGLVATTTIAIVLIEVPHAFNADRGNRVRRAMSS